jgi:hypothetical protein
MRLCRPQADQSLAGWRQDDPFEVGQQRLDLLSLLLGPVDDQPAVVGLLGRHNAARCCPHPAR